MNCLIPPTLDWLAGLAVDLSFNVAVTKIKIIISNQFQFLQVFVELLRFRSFSLAQALSCLIVDLGRDGCCFRYVAAPHLGPFSPII